MSDHYQWTGNGLQNENIPTREEEGYQPKEMRVFVQTIYRLMVDRPGLEPMPAGMRLQRGEPLPTNEFTHLNVYTAQHAADQLQIYVNKFICQLPEAKAERPARVRADRR